MSDYDKAQAARRRDDGLRGVSNLTAAIAALSIVGTGGVVYAVASHAPTTTPASTVQSGTTSTATTGTTTAPGTATGAPVAASHGS